MAKTRTWNERKAETMTRLQDPQFGDRFQEMYSAWMHIIGRIGPLVVVHVLNGGGGEVRVHMSVDAFVKRSVYGGSMSESSPWTYEDNIGEKVLDYLHSEYLPND